MKYVTENGNPLENDEHERGVVRRIDRLNAEKTELLREWTGPGDPVKRGLAVKKMDRHWILNVGYQQ